MKQRWHLSNGESKPCSAKPGGCPITLDGEEAPHGEFNTKNEANAYFEGFMKASHGGNFTPLNKKDSSVTDDVEIVRDPKTNLPKIPDNMGWKIGTLHHEYGNTTGIELYEKREELRFWLEPRASGSVPLNSSKDDIFNEASDVLRRHHNNNNSIKDSSVTDDVEIVRDPKTDLPKLPDNMGWKIGTFHHEYGNTTGIELYEKREKLRFWLEPLASGSVPLNSSKDDIFNEASDVLRRHHNKNNSIKDSKTKTPLNAKNLS